MAQNNPPITTIPPFANTALLPACASFCGPLFDANGACVPPAAPTAAASAYTSCFCHYSALAPFASATAGVCDAACAGTDGLNTIAGWFRDVCHIKAVPGGNGQVSSSSTSGAPGSTSGADKSGSHGGGGDWLSTHWKWVVMLVVLVIGIAGIWIGACIWHRRYLKKKDRQTSLGQKHSGSANRPSWGPPVTGSGDLGNPGGFYGEGANANNSRSRGIFMAGSGPMDESPREKKRWNVRDRT